MNKTHKIVVALDVDEVLNHDGLGTVEHPLVVPAADLPNSPFLRGGGERDLSTIVRLDPRHGEWINSLLERGIEVVWATTWEEAANTHLAPLLGIPPLPVAVSVTAHPPRFGWVHNGNTGAWKADALAERYPDPEVALVWVDDLAHHWDEDTTLSDRELLADSGASAEEIESWLPLDRHPLRPGPTLIIAPPTGEHVPPEQRGLTEEIIERIEQWIAKGPQAHPDAIPNPRTGFLADLLADLDDD